jgi:hypothetical protein
MLSPEPHEEWCAGLAEAARRNEAWAGTNVADRSAERLSRPVSYPLGRSYLIRLKHSPQEVPRPRNALVDTEQQEIFKNPSSRSGGRWRQLFPTRG